MHPVVNRSKVRDGAMTINVELASLSLSFNYALKKRVIFISSQNSKKRIHK